uniref:Uncharacterized protein n=1 Tax=Pundamilia nyererei TaxID=303518 RepID=A0A3B4G854_9CICH
MHTFTNTQQCVKHFAINNFCMKHEIQTKCRCREESRHNDGLVKVFSRHCSSLQWFCDSAALDTEDSLETQKVYKFRGDLAVRQGNYQLVFSFLTNLYTVYSSCLQWIADNNLTIRRDVVEGMARCCTRLGQRDRALELAQLLVILYLTGFLKLSKYYEYICLFLPYLNLTGSFSSEICVNQHDEQEDRNTEEASELSEDRVWLKERESRATVCLHSFRQRWWNKILLTGLLETDGPELPVLLAWQRHR